VHVLVSHAVILRRLDQCKNPAGTLLNVSCKSAGNLLGWICRHPVYIPLLGVSMHLIDHVTATATIVLPLLMFV